MAAILITVELPGSIGGRVKHIESKKNAVKISDSEYLVKTIVHNDLPIKSCQRITKIGENIVESWIFGGCPEWIEDKKWKALSNHQRVSQYVNRFDEGYGVSFEYLD